jgi:hypothetical protein
MSSLTLDNLAEVVRNRLGLPPNEVPRLKTLVNGALQSLAYKVSRRGDRALLVVEINKAPVAGKIDLSVADFDAILIDTYRMEGAVSAPGLIFQHASSLQKLQTSMPTDTTYVWYFLRDRALVFRNPTTGALDTFATSVHLAGSRIPTLADMPPVYDMEIEDELAMLAEGKGDAINLSVGGPQG